ASEPPALPTLSLHDALPISSRRRPPHMIHGTRAERGPRMSTRAKRPDLVIFIAALGLVVIGLVIVFSASYSTGMQRFQDPYYYIKRQLVGAALALGVFAVVQRIDYRLLRPLALPGLILSFFLLIVVLLVGSEAGGSKAWLNLGGLRFQPAEVV